MGAQRYSFLNSPEFDKSGKASIITGSTQTGKLSSKGILGAIRHPFYAGLFPLIWARDLDISFFIVNIILSIYLIIGTLLEERKLLLEFGDAPDDYQQKVSMLSHSNSLRLNYRKVYIIYKRRFKLISF